MNNTLSYFNLEPDFSASKLSTIAVELMNREVEMCAAMSKNGADLINEGDGILTHCNTGALAVPGMVHFSFC